MHGARTLTHRALVVGAALSFALAGTALSPVAAHAVTQETEAKLTETQKQVESSAAAYDEATANVQKLQQQINDNQTKIDEIEAKLPDMREKAGKAMRASYKNQQGTNVLMSLVLQSDSLEDLLTRVTYLNQIQSSNTEALSELNDAEQQLEQQKTELAQAKAQADTEQQKADEALKQAQQLREAAQAQADKEAADELAALQQAAAQQAAGNGTQASASGSAQAGTVDNSAVDWSVDEATFVAQWGPRIDAYLAGSPLAGYGNAFASAAWKYGVDPRFSPAISNTESSKGANCFLPCNAWGWGSKSWSSWEQAIDSHVSGLAAGYGYTISVKGAQKYCPPNWYEWYNKTLAEMNKI